LRFKDQRLMTSSEQFVRGGEPGEARPNDHYFLLLSPSLKMLGDTIMDNFNVISNGMFRLHDASGDKVDLSYPKLISFSITIFAHTMQTDYA